jgi:hypothetical protein
MCGSIEVGCVVERGEVEGREESRPSMIAGVGRGRIRKSGRMLEAPLPPSRSAAPGRDPQTRCSALSRGWCARQMARGCGCRPRASGWLAGRDRSRRPGRGRTWCSLTLLAWRGSSRAEGCSAKASSRRSWESRARSCRSRPGGRTRSSRWRLRFACRNPGRTGVSSRKTWRLFGETRGRTSWREWCRGLNVFGRQ